MIGGISSQVGFTEEKPDLQALRPREDKGFDRVLQRAAEGRRRNLEASTTASEPRHVARRRALFEEREAEPKRTDADPSAQGDGSRVAPQEPQETDTAKAPSAQGRENVQSRAPSEPPSEEEQAAVAADGRVLEDAFIDPDQAARAAQATHLSGLGLVSYQLSPHGKGEAELAAQAGLTPQAQGQRIASAQLDVAAQGIESGEVLKKAAPEEVLPGKTPRQQFPDLVEVAKPEDLSESELDQLAAKAESKSDAGRLALLNSMRQPPPGKTEAMASAFGLESGAGLKNGKVKGEGGEQGRTLFQVMPRGAEAAQTQSTVPNLTAPDRSTFGALQQPDDAQRPLMERVTQEVRWMIRNDRSEATIRLEPDHLGTMRIKVVQQDGALRVDMTVDNQLARNLIESRLSDLQQRLQEQNTGAEQFSFNVNVQDNGGWESFRQAPHTARTMPYIPVTPEGESAHVAMTAGVSKPVWGQQGVGIYA